MIRVALTGGAGFVGSAIARALVASGAHVLVIDDYSTGLVKNIQDVACDNHQMDAGLADYSTSDVVVHAAAAPDVSGNWTTENARTVQWERNADLTRRVLDRTPKGATFILISTCSVYGPGEVNEDSLLRSTSPYASSKIAAEALVQAYDEAGRIRGRIVRLVNVVGPRYLHGHLFDFVTMANTGKLHALDDGEKRKSFVHVDDVADEVAYLAVSAQTMPLEPRDRHEAPIRNITSNVLWSWRDSVAVMRAMRPQKKFDLTCEPRPSGWVGDPSKLIVHSKVLEGRPRRSIVEGVTAALVDLGW